MDINSLPIILMNFDGSNESKDALGGIKGAICEASQIADNLVEQLRIDGIKNVDGSLDEEILVRIRNAAYVVCDTTGNRPNVYFELGYAFAHNKTIFLVHRANTERPHFNIRNKYIIFYSGGNFLQSELTTAIKQYLENIKGGSGKLLKDFFQRINIPVLPLEGDGRYIYKLKSGKSPIRIDVEGVKYQPPKKWRNKFKEVFKKQDVDAKNRGRTLFEGTLFRVVDFIPDRDEVHRTRSIRLNVQSTDYYTFISSNHCWAYLDPDDCEKLRSYENSVIQNPRKSNLANALSVNIFVVCIEGGEEYIFFQRRNIDKVSHAKQGFACSAGGMVSDPRDIGPFGPNVFSTATNEVKEELGHNVTESDITFRALVRDTVNYEIAMLGEISLDIDSDKLLKPIIDCFEHKGLVKCKLIPEDVTKFIKDEGGLSNFTPMCLGAVAFVLLGRFSPERIEDAFTKLPEQPTA